MISLRPYQDELISRLRVALRSHRRVLTVAPTGAGKTVMFSFMAAAASAKGLRVEILAHREELLDQISGTLARFNVRHGFIAAGRDIDLGMRVNVSSVLTRARRLDRVPAPDLVIIDEAHHCTAASTYGTVLSHWPKAHQIGVTATPQRLDGTGLSECFDAMVLGPTVRELIGLGSLCAYRLYAPSQPDLGAVHTRAGDYAKGELATAMDKSTITGDAVSHYRRHAGGKRAVVFCVSIDHAEHVAEQFRQAGFTSQRIDGAMDRVSRKLLVQAFSKGEIKVLTSCDLISEGFDLPAIECAILLRPTQSLSLYLQQVGRALRPFPGKDRAMILDHAGNCQRHGLPDDEREWSLAGRDKKAAKGESAVPVRTCEKCFAALPAAVDRCPHCGFVFAAKPREVQHVDGELSEVDLERARQEQRRQAVREQARSQTLDDLVALGRQRGYRSPERWAAAVMHARSQKAAARHAERSYGVVLHG